MNDPEKELREALRRLEAVMMVGRTAIEARYIVHVGVQIAGYLRNQLRIVDTILEELRGENPGPQTYTMTVMRAAAIEASTICVHLLKTLEANIEPRTPKY